MQVATKVYEKLAWPYVRASGQLADNEATADTTVHGACLCSGPCCTYLPRAIV